MNNRGFTLIEIVITLVIVSILLVLSVVSLDSAMISARDEERKSDIETLSSYLESFYNSGSQLDATIGQYPPVGSTNPLTDNVLTTNTNELSLLRDVDLDALIAPDADETTLSSIIAATNYTQTVLGVSPQPTSIQYVYQPISNDGTLCDNLPSTETCRKFNLYYRTETDDTIKMISSRHQ